MELPDRFFEPTGLALGVRHRGQRLRPIEVRAFLAADLLERYHAAHRVTEAERLHELALRVAQGRHDEPATSGTHRFDGLETHGVEQCTMTDARAAIITGDDTVIEQHRLTRPQAGAAQHLLGRDFARLAGEREPVAAGRAVEGQRAVLGKQLERAREGFLSGVRDRVVRETAAGLRTHLGEQRLTGAFPGRDRLG